MDNFADEANKMLDLYKAYFEYDGNDYDAAVIEDLRWDFHDAAIALAEKMTGRKVSDEL